MENNKKTIFSGVQPSGNLHLGNYLGAIKQWVDLQNEYNCIFCVVDYHAITVPQNPKTLAEKTIEIAKLYIASGIDPKKSIIFKQSDIKEHTELAWILNCTCARMSDLNKMTQFKDKAGENENVGVGLFDYPVLMAADILLYDTDIVPVGFDQSQHVELSRTLARRFNDKFGETLKIPELRIKKEGARIVGLDDPTKKMSKSASSEANYIALLDEPQKATKKIMKATTDSDGIIKYNFNKKPGISNLLTIYSLLENIEIKELENKYKNSGYGDFKKDLSEVVENFLTDFQKRYNTITNNKIEKIFTRNKKSLQRQTLSKIKEIKNKIGVV